MKCCVPECTTAVSESKYKVPEPKFKEWMTIIGRSDLIGVPNEERKRMQICKRHFRPDQVCVFLKKTSLQPDAYPSINLPEIPTANEVPHASTSSVKEEVYNAKSYSENINPLKPQLSASVATKNGQPIRFKIIQRRLQPLTTKKLGPTWKSFLNELPKSGQIFLQMLYRNHKRSKTERQYTIREKALAISLYKSLGDRSYNVIRSIFKYIPAVRRLNPSSK